MGDRDQRIVAAVPERDVTLDRRQIKSPVDRESGVVLNDTFDAAPSRLADEGQHQSGVGQQCHTLRLNRRFHDVVHDHPLRSVRSDPHQHSGPARVFNRPAKQQPVKPHPQFTTVAIIDEGMHRSERGDSVDPVDTDGCTRQGIGAPCRPTGHREMLVTLFGHLGQGHIGPIGNRDVGSRGRGADSRPVDAHDRGSGRHRRLAQHHRIEPAAETPVTPQDRISVRVAQQFNTHPSDRTTLPPDHPSPCHRTIPNEATMTTTHPRPDLRRDPWWPLDGEWDFGFGREGGDGFDDAVFDRTIIVPFAYQSPAGGISDTTEHEVLWYRRRVDLPDANGGRLLIHFGAVDYEATVWLARTEADGDGTVGIGVTPVEVAHNIGGHVPFVADVTAGAGEKCALIVRVIDRTADDQPRGKQLAGPSEPFSEILYTPTSGIWQPVWLEQVGRCHVCELHVAAGADGHFTVAVDVRSGSATGPGADSGFRSGNWTVECDVALDDSGVTRATGVVDADGHAVVEGRVEHPECWSPDSPTLYDLKISIVDGDTVDTVRTRMGFRTISTDGDRIVLNGRPIVLRMALDQGYWPDTLMSLPSDEDGSNRVRDEIAWLRQAGFNGVRKHMKIEDPRWWWWADELGLLVWQDMPTGAFHRPADDTLRSRLADEWQRAIRRDRSHASAICFSPFNESWGINGVGDDPELQAYVRGVVARTRELAPDALVVDNSGWLHVDTDLFDIHRYDHDPAVLRTVLEAAITDGWKMDWRIDFEAFGNWGPAADADGIVHFDTSPSARGDAVLGFTGQPVVISELGGVGFVVPDDGIEGGEGTDIGHSPTSEERFVYSEAATADEFADAISQLVGVVEELGLAGWCWTQVSDIEQEQNGLFTYDRRPKLPARRIAEAIGAAVARRPRHTSGP